MIELLIKGKLAIEAEGQLDLPKQPPFDVLTPGWAAKAIVQLGDGDPNLIKVFDAWYFNGKGLDVRAGDGRGTWVWALMQCVEMDRQQGLQVTRAWDPPRRRAPADDRSPFYRPSPRFQHITKSAYTYVLAAERYEWCAAPGVFKRRSLVVEAVN